MPVSATVTSTVGPATATVSLTSPPFVYLIPLASRFRRMLVSASSSVSRVSGAFSSLTVTVTAV